MRTLIGAILALLLSTPAVGYSQARFEDWNVLTSANGESVIAGTMNTSGQVLAQGCWFSTRDCVWMIGLDISCVKGQKGHVLVNAGSKGTAMLEIYCLEGTDVGGGHYRYAFTDFDKIDEIVRANSAIGLAVALRDGQFQVVRFSLAGAPSAVASMRDRAQKRTEKTPAWRTTRDQLL